MNYLLMIGFVLLGLLILYVLMSYGFALKKNRYFCVRCCVSKRIFYRYEDPYYGFVEKHCPCCGEELIDMKEVKNHHDATLLSEEINRRANK